MRRSAKTKKSTAAQSLFLDTGSKLSGPHYILCLNEAPFLLYTTDLAGCVGISFVSEEPNMMALYHSYSEHDSSDQEFIKKAFHSEYDEEAYGSGNLVRVIRDFMGNIENLENVKVVIHINKVSEGEGVDRLTASTFNQVKELIHNVNRLSGREDKLTDESFTLSEGNSTFCIMNDGSYYSPDDKEQLEEVAKKIAMHIYKTIAETERELGALWGGKTISLLEEGKKKTGTHTDKKIVHEIKLADEGTISWVKACENIHAILKERVIAKPTGVFSVGKRDESSQASYEQFRNMVEYLFNLKVKLPALRSAPEKDRSRQHK